MTDKYITLNVMLTSLTLCKDTVSVRKSKVYYESH